MKLITQEIIADLKSHRDAKYYANLGRFFTHQIKAIGVPKPVLKAREKYYFQELQKCSTQDILHRADQLVKLHIHEASAIGVLFALRVKKHYTKKDFALFESWVENDLQSWADCDDLCGGPLKYIFKMYPELVAKTTSWQTSSKGLMRRAAVVSLIYVEPTPELLPIIFKRVLLLAKDSDLLVLKGCGWLLKKVSAVYPEEVIAFLITHKKQLPAVIITYAIEKMSANQKKYVRKGVT